MSYLYSTWMMNRKIYKKRSNYWHTTGVDTLYGVQYLALIYELLWVARGDHGYVTEVIYRKPAC